MRENRPSSLMSGVWKRSMVLGTMTPRHTSTLHWRRSATSCVPVCPPLAASPFALLPPRSRGVGLRRLVRTPAGHPDSRSPTPPPRRHHRPPVAGAPGALGPASRRCHTDRHRVIRRVEDAGQTRDLTIPDRGSTADVGEVMARPGAYRRFLISVLSSGSCGDASPGLRNPPNPPAVAWM
jgi:hypothetical protein